ncbi:MAG: hypothetical protein VYA60_07755 [Pseudomonadota bacterium]|nr:hypothetical protein [Pseudomonadota bacterium]
MLTILNTLITTVKEILALAKELKPLYKTITGNYVPSQSQIAVLKIFLLSFLGLTVLLASLGALTLMMVHLPTVAGYLELDIIYKISETARGFMRSLILIGYLMTFLVLAIAFLYTLYETVKALIKKMIGR